MKRVALACLLHLGCADGPPLVPLSPAELGEELGCRSDEVEKTFSGMQANAVAGRGWKWLKRTTIPMNAGDKRSLRVATDPALYYEVLLNVGNPVQIYLEVRDPSGKLVLRDASFSGRASVNWNSTEPGQYELTWGFGGDASACAGLGLIVQPKKKP